MNARHTQHSKGHLNSPGSRTLLCIRSTVCLALLSAACGNPVQTVSTQPAAYLIGTSEQLTLVFRLAPIKPPAKAPTPPAGYTTHQMSRWNFTGGDGLLLITRNSFGAFGVLSEMFYFPGLYQTRCTDKVYSAQRVWVDMDISRKIGRDKWGFPKEMATFTWRPQSVEVKGLDGSTIFRANFADSNSQQKLPAWFSRVVSHGLPTLQWAIQNPPDPTGDAAAAAVGKLYFGENLPSPSQYQGNGKGAEANVLAEAAAAQLSMESADPNKQQLTFPKYDHLLVTKTASIYTNAALFTGRTQAQQIVADPLVGIITGSPGQLTSPTPYKCP